MPEPGFCSPDLEAFCLLDRLGLTVAGQDVAEDRTVLTCRVVEPDDVVDRSCWVSVAECRAFRGTRWSAGSRTCRSGGARRAGRVAPDILHVTVRRYRCPGLRAPCGGRT